MKRLFCFFILILSIISCQLNPFVGVGPSVDTVAPSLKISSHENFQYVSGKLLYLYGTCSDNQKVTSVSLRAEHEGEVLFIWEIKNPVSPWSYSIQLDPLADIKKQVQDGVAGKDFRLPDGQYKFTVFAHDAGGYTSSDSYDSRTLVVDNEPSVTEITYPLLKTSMDFYVGDDSRGETAGADSYNFDNNEYFRNGNFYIQGNIDDQYSPANVTLTLTEYNEQKNETGKSLTVSFGASQEFNVESNIEKYLLDVDTSKKPASLWNWTIHFKENAENENDIKTPHYYKVSIRVKDSAGNIESDEKGFFCVLPKTDYPYTIFPGYGQKIPVGTPLSGTSYDDDGIKSVKLSLCNGSGELIDAKEDLYEEDVDGANIYTWKTDKCTPTTGGEYLLKIEVIDINGRSSSYIVNEAGDYLHSEEYREKKLTIVDLTAPSVEIMAKKGKESTAKEIDFDVYSDVVDESGDFRVAVKVTDASQVRKVYLARVLNNANSDEILKLDAINPKTGNIDAWDLSANVAGIKFYNLYEYKAGDKAMAEVQANQAFNIFNDFENEFATKRFYVYAENASGKTTVSSKLLLKEEDKPEIIVSEPLQGSTLTVPFNIGVSADDFTGIADLTIECVQNGKNTFNKLTLADFEIKKQEGNEINIPPFSSDLFAPEEEFASGSCTLTFTAKDKYGNVTIEKLQFYVEKDDPFIKNVIAEKNVATYKTGDIIKISLEINKEVNVSGGVPELTLDLGKGRTATAVYKSKKENYLVFEYIVAKGDDCELLNCIELDLKGATVEDSQKMPLDETSLLTEGSGALMTNATIRIDTVLPEISAIKSINPNDFYSIGEKIEIQMIFSENVTINVPDGERLRLKLNVTGKDCYADYVSEYDDIGKNKAMFVYTVEAGDNVGELAWTGWDVSDKVEITDSAVGVGDIGDKGNKFEFIDSDAEKYKWSNKLVIDTAPANIERIESSFINNDLSLGGCCETVDGEEVYYCNEGKLINLFVVFSESVKVSGEATLVLSSGSVATYSSGSGSEKLCFSYTVGVGDNTDGNLKVDGINGKIIDYADNETKEFPEGVGTIKETEDSSKDKNLIIDTTAPEAPTISIPPANTHDTSGIDVYTDMVDGKTKGVEVTGQIFDKDVYSYCWTENKISENFEPYSSNEGIKKTFGNNESEGFYQDYAVSLKLKDKAGNVSADSEIRNFVIDTDKPRLTKASSSTVNKVDGSEKLETSTTGIYTAGEIINVSLVFNKNVTATGVKVKLNNGKEITIKDGDTVHIEGTDDYFLTGEYKVEQNEQFNEYLKIKEVIAGSVVDCLENKLDSNKLNEMLIAAGFENIDAFQEIKIDSILPTIKSISSSNDDGWYTAGKVIMINVEFSESVEFSGDNPRLKLAGGGEASYSSGSGTANWLFSYTVAADQNTGDSSEDTGFLKAASISGKITDLAGVSVDGNSLNATIPEDNFKDRKIGIDTDPPAALTLKGIYSVDDIEIKNGDNKSGKDGEAYVEVYCAGGSEPNAVFYVTKNGEVEQEWGSPFNSVQCQPNPGEVLNYTIVAVQRDPAGNVSQEASIAFTIDNSPIILERIETTTPSGTCTVGDEIPITLTFNKEVKVSAPITVTLNATRSDSPIEVPIPASDTYVKEVTGYYDVQKGDITTEVLNVSALEGVVEDRLPTSLNLGEVKDDLTPLSTATNLAATKQITIDTNAPTLTSITTMAIDGWYKADDVIAVTLTFNEDVKVADDTELKMSSKGTAKYQSVKGQVVNFIYKVAAGDTTGTNKDLKVLCLQSGEITDMAGNLWNATLPSDNFAGKAIGIDTAINDITIVNDTDEDPDGKSYLNTQTLTISGLTDAGSGRASYECFVNGKEKTLSISGNGEATIECIANPGVNTSFAVGVKMTDHAGNVEVKNISFRIDGEEIELQSISTTTASGTYKAGTIIPVTLTFNKAIKVTEEITVILNNNEELPPILTNDEYSTTLTAEYTVSIGDKGNSLDVKSITGKVEDSRPKTLTFSSDLPTETTIADTRTINIDTEVPTVESFSSTAADGWYNAGKMIQITMTCSEIVNVTGKPTLSLSSGGEAIYLSGSGSKNIVFVYNVAAGNSTGTSKSLKVTGINGTIQDIAKNDLSSSLPSHDFPCGIDTAAPEKLTIGGITNGGIVTSCDSLVISGFGETGGSGIFDYTISVNGTNMTIPDSVSDGKLTFSELPENVRDSLTVIQGGKQSFTISVYQTDVAGNKSAVSDRLSFTVDTNKTRLLAVKSSKSNETCTTGAVIDITLEFSRSTSGSISIVLNNDKTISGGNWSNDGFVYTATYKVGSAAGETKSPLQITGISGTVRDDLGTQNMSALWNTSSMNLSSYNVSIDTIAPSCSALDAKYNDDGSATLTYTFNENVSIVAGKKITLAREAYAAPIVLTPAQYNEYYTLNSGIKTYYEKTINGVDPSDKEKADLSAKYVLKYQYNPTEPGLVDIFTDMGYYKQEIVMESSAVAVSGKVVTVTVPKENLMTGETYTVTTDTGIVKDIVGLTSGSIATKTLSTGNKPQPPVIRVNKISGRGDTAKTTTVKIHTVTKDATVYYDSSNSTGYDETPETKYSESSSVTWREKPYYGVTIGSNAGAGKYWITAKATKGNTDSDISYERAFKTVLKSTSTTNHENKTDSTFNDSGFRVFRGGDVKSGSNTISGFPVTWDEKSVPSNWKPSTTDMGDTLEEELAEYGMLLAKNNMAITWGVPEIIHFHGLHCKIRNNTKLIWRWQENDAKEVNAGSSADDTNKFEQFYHDRDGGNYD